MAVNVRSSDEQVSNENGSDSDTENDAGLPVVFQCSKCRSILGDSLSWVSACEKLSIITLKCVSSKVHVDRKLTMSPDGPDIGSTYVGLQCTECDHNVGRMYKTTSKDLDDIRNLYSLHVTAIESYKVGSSQQQNPEDDDTHDEFLSTSKIKVFFAQVRKIQSLVIMLNKRVSAIESSFEEDGESVNVTTSDSTLDPAHNSPKKPSNGSLLSRSERDENNSSSSSHKKRKITDSDQSATDKSLKKKKYK